MKAMILETPGMPLRLADVPIPEPGFGQLRVKVHACGVCRTNLHVVDGELPDPKLPIIPGHEIVGTVDKLGEGAGHWKLGQRVGIPWLGWTDGDCRYCRSGRENLCDHSEIHGLHNRRRIRRVPPSLISDTFSASRNATRMRMPRLCCAPGLSAIGRCG